MEIVYFKITFPVFSWSYRQNTISRDFFLPADFLYVDILYVRKVVVLITHTTEHLSNHHSIKSTDRVTARAT